MFSVDVTSAFTESVFSVVKGTKTMHRGRLSEKNMNNYVRLRATRQIVHRESFPASLELRSLDVRSYKFRNPEAADRGGGGGDEGGGGEGGSDDGNSSDSDSSDSESESAGDDDEVELEDGGDAND